MKLSSEADELDGARGQRVLGGYPPNSSKINHLLSVLMSSDSLQPPPTGNDIAISMSDSEFKSPEKVLDLEFDNKRRIEFPAPEGMSKRRYTSLRNKSRGVEESVTDTPIVSSATNRDISMVVDEAETAERDPAHALHLDDEDHEWFRTLFRSSVTPREQSAGNSFADPAPPHVGGAMGSSIEDHFSNSFPFSPASPMFHNSARLTPSRRAAPFFSLDLDMSASPRREHVNSGSNLNRDFIFNDIEIPAYEPRMKELSLPPKRLKRKKKRSDSAAFAETSGDFGEIPERFDDAESHGLGLAEAVNAMFPLHSEYHEDSAEREVEQEPDQSVFAMIPPLPSIPPRLLVIPLHEEVHIKLDPISSLEAATDTIIPGLSTCDLLPRIPMGFLQLPVLQNQSNHCDNSPHSEVVLSTQDLSLPTELPHIINTVDLKDVFGLPNSVTFSEGAKEVETTSIKAKKKTISILVHGIITLLDVNILVNYEEGMSLTYSKGELSQYKKSCSSCSNQQPHLNAALQLAEVQQRLSSKDIIDLTNGNLSASNIAKVLGESHHRRVWEVVTMMTVLGLVSVIYRCSDFYLIYSQF